MKFIPEKNVECEIVDDKTLESYDYGSRAHGDVFEILATSFLATGTVFAANNTNHVCMFPKV